MSTEQKTACKLGSQGFKKLRKDILTVIGEIIDQGEVLETQSEFKSQAYQQDQAVIKKLETALKQIIKVEHNTYGCVQACDEMAQKDVESSELVDYFDQSSQQKTDALCAATHDQEPHWQKFVKNIMKHNYPDNRMPWEVSQEDDGVELMEGHGSDEAMKFRCPLSTKLIETIATCSTCKHNYESSLIDSYLHEKGRPTSKECPVVGCNAILHPGEGGNVVHEDEEMVVALERYTDRQQQNDRMARKRKRTMTQTIEEEEDED
eukprot:TRINITY_DN66640_c5_g1_i1.p2 TRINITY_DN66640_c5_g1~~TRINITY_DN66640_c5_g1_i1.p2  ORF type:complete len:263 (-),score=33.39 TRINITY_DN66640_c5_g1_i1:2239-3027(-)